MTIVRTYFGNEIDLLNPNPNRIDIRDIAHHLSKLDRYNGATPSHYSVGQHSLYVMACLPQSYKLWGLLHDATEAYLGDVVSPLKSLLPAYKEIEEGISRAVCERFNLDCMDYSVIKAADKAVMAAEMIQLLGWHDKAEELGVVPADIAITLMDWHQVSYAMQNAFNELTRKVA